MNTSETKNSPAYRIFSVTKISKDKTDWQAIGAAWAHKDGKGFNPRFSARPLEGSAVVLRLPTQINGDAS